ncbi:hypothetical protein [Maribacter luteus]|uniref:DUF4412 domain-containing protein n=1 Tax=Maribacter luteus TaxID=2594478 RepID=A0A6I2MUH9_9FLAO|nr:hypothetical protein [Maribacter luteus]MRX66230.1 hypothetical protein [Maribacter luteus]
MKTKIIITTLLALCLAMPTQAQFFKKLKKVAENAVERTVLNRTDKEVSKTTNNTIDSIAKGGKDKKDNSKNIGETEKNLDKKEKQIPTGTEFENPSLKKNIDAKWAWYTSDVRVTSYDKQKESNMVSYFDADAVAMRSDYVDQVTGAPLTSYTDSEGFFISYNPREQRYTKTSLFAMPGMSMMAPSMMASAYKLPEGSIFEGMEAMEKQGLAVYPFMHVDFPFVIRPEHFRDEMIADRYKESQIACRGSMDCTKFSVVESGHEGSYILFDNQNRLIEINIVIKNDPYFESGKGKIEYFYENVEVQVPAAVEKKMFGQDLLKKGMENN